MPDLPSAATLTDSQRHAINAYARAVLGRLKSEGGVHAETAIAAAAGMAGTCLLRSLALPIDDLDPGSPLFNEQCDELAPALVKAVIASLAELGVAIDPARVPAQIPDDHRPQMSLLQIQLTVGVPYRAATRRCGLDQRQAAFASAAAAARIIKDTASVLDPHLAVAIAAHACTEATRTVPVTIPGGDEDDSGQPRKPWYRFW